MGSGFGDAIAALVVLCFVLAGSVAGFAVWALWVLIAGGGAASLWLVVAGGLGGWAAQRHLCPL